MMTEVAGNHLSGSVYRKRKPVQTARAYRPQRARRPPRSRHRGGLKNDSSVAYVTTITPTTAEATNHT